MEKQTLTKQDVQKDLLTKLNGRKGCCILLTVITIIGIVLYPIHLINYLNDAPFDYTGGIRSPDLKPTAAMFVMPLLITFFVVVVFYWYYIDLYKIKKGKFEIIQDTLHLKKKEWKNYYRTSRLENSLYFYRCGRVAVEDEVYSYSHVEDEFYIVVLKTNLNSKRNPLLAYHAKYYKISSD